MSQVIVSSASALVSALSSAVSGETILLAPGTYSAFNVQNIKIAGNVTVESEYASNPAVLTKMYVTNSSGLTFSNLTMSTVGSTDLGPFRITSSQNITFNSLLIQGNQTQATANGGTCGVDVTGSTNVSITNSTFNWIKDGIKQLSNNGVTISGNTFENMTGDGVDGGGTSNLTVSNNLFTDFHTLPGDHPDAVQVWTTGFNYSVSNINVTGNVFVRGNGNGAQGVNIEDEVGNLTYTNVNISNNTIIGGDGNGIYLQHAVSSTVSNNNIIGYADDKSDINVLSSTSTTVSGNSADGYSLTGSVTQSNNTTVGAPTDGGAAQFQAWLNAHPQFALSSLPAELQALVAPLPANAATYTAAATDVSAKFNALNADTALTKVTVSDNASVVLSASQFMSDTRALSHLVNANGTAYQVTVGDIATTIAADFDTLNANSHISSIIVSDFGWVRLTAAQLISDTHALAVLQTPTPDAAVPTVVAHDTAANLSAHFDALNALASKGTLIHAEVSDGQALSLTATQDTADTSLLALLSGVKAAVHDTAANISAHLAGLVAAGNVSSLTVSDGGTVTVANSAYSSDSALLAAITGAHTIEVTGYGGVANTNEFLVYGSTGALASQTIDNANGTVSVTVSADHLNLSDPMSGAETIATNNHAYLGFTVTPGAGSETISGYQLATDTLSFSHTLFATAAAVIGAATSDGHGDTVINVGSGHNVTLSGITVAQLTQYESHFLFY